MQIEIIIHIVKAYVEYISRICAELVSVGVHRKSVILLVGIWNIPRVVMTGSVL